MYHFALINLEFDIEFYINNRFDFELSILDSKIFFSHNNTDILRYICIQHLIFLNTPIDWFLRKHDATYTAYYLIITLATTLCQIYGKLVIFKCIL